MAVLGALCAGRRLALEAEGLGSARQTLPYGCCTGLLLTTQHPPPPPPAPKDCGKFLSGTSADQNFSLAPPPKKISTTGGGGGGGALEPPSPRPPRPLKTSPAAAQRTTK